MSNTNDEPAFPCGRDVTLDQFAPTLGLTIRDYFAAKAMAALIACAPNHGDVPHREAAVDAYRYADAMLEARK